VQNCTTILEAFNHLATYYGDKYSILDSLDHEIAGEGYIPTDKTNPHVAMMKCISKIQTAIMNKVQFFPNEEITKNQAIKSICSLCPQSEAEFGLPILETYKKSIKTPQYDS